MSAPGSGSPFPAWCHDTHGHERHLVANNLDWHCVTTDAADSTGERSLSARYSAFYAYHKIVVLLCVFVNDLAEKSCVSRICSELKSG